MTKEQWDDLGERALNTFVQGAVAAAPVGPLADWSAARGALAAMAVGGLGALLSAVQSMLRARRSTSRL
jgi:hypothetical protein